MSLTCWRVRSGGAGRVPAAWGYGATPASDRLPSLTGFAIATLNEAIVRHREIGSISLDATPWVRVVDLACGFTGGTPLIAGLLASLRGQSGLQRPAQSRLDGRSIGLIVILNGLPDAHGDHWLRI